MTGTLVLVVDDSQTVRKEVCAPLLAAGFTVLEAVDGLDALAKLAKTVGVGLIVCDLNMPRVDGLKFLERVMREGTGRRVPVLMLTSEGERDLVGRAKALGARGWIVKPFKADQLVAAVSRVTSQGVADQGPGMLRP